MNESEGLLPSRSDSITDGGSLPATSPASRLAGPVAAPTAGPAAGPTAPLAPPAAPPVAAVQSIEERLAAITAAGGLTALPPDFGDSHGEWSTVRSDNPFAVLCLDYRQAHRITPETVERHRGLLQRFWQEKLRSMSQGAARVAILKKYGGADQSERLIRAYPELIDRAYQKLATRGGIEAECRRLAEERDTALFARIDERLNDFLVDSVLQADEVRALFEFGEKEGASRSAVAERIHDRLRTKGLVPEHPSAGATLEERLLSTAWVHPDRQATTLAAVAPVRKSLLFPLFFFSFVVVTVLLIAAAMRTRTAVTSGELPAVDTTILPATATVAAVAPVRTETVPTLRTVAPKPEPPEEVQSPKELEPPRPRVNPEEQRRLGEELKAVRELADSDPEAGLARIAGVEASLGAEYVDERIEVAQLRAELEKAVLRRQLVAEQDRQRDEAEERARVEREREWARRVAAIEELMKQPNYSGAKTLADQFLADPEIPPEPAERIRQLREQSLAELQKIFAGAKVKSRTGRSPRRQQ